MIETDRLTVADIENAKRILDKATKPDTQVYMNGRWMEAGEFFMEAERMYPKGKSK